MEAQAGLDNPISAGDASTPGRDLLLRTQRSMGRDEAYFGFHLGDAETWLWVVAREGFELHRLPPRAALAEAVKEFERGVRGNHLEAGEMGQRLYAQLFAGVGKALEKPVWILGLDGALFEMPFAALVEGTTTGHRHYVVERHALEVTPGVMSLMGPPTANRGGAVLVLGDAIYNRADPRWKGTRPKATEVSDQIQLPRLAGSAREIDACARIWRRHGVEPAILTGASASKQKFIAGLQTKPAIVHVAAHVVFPVGAIGSGLIALTLKPEGGTEFLSVIEIANLKVKIGLVALNGCNSAAGQVLPGTGLMGMTRAWLAAGAHAVITRRWPVDDDAGEFSNLFISTSAPRATRRIEAWWRARSSGRKSTNCSPADGGRGPPIGARTLAWSGIENEVGSSRQRMITTGSLRSDNPGASPAAGIANRNEQSKALSRTSFLNTKYSCPWNRI